MTQAHDPIVRIEGLTKSFGTAVALHEMNLTIAPGEFVTFLGPSGCGKSTTLRILGGFETPNTGRIILGGEDVTHLPPNRRNVNMVFQDYALFPHMTTRRNIAFGLELKGMSKAAIAARIDELAAFLELSNYLDRRPDQLSGGQRQRVALARALAPDPELLLLDEPLGALDAKLRSQVQIELKNIQQRTKKAFFFVTHDQEEALTMSDRIVVMNKGRIEQDGTPEDLYHRPANRFVAEFIGETNFLDGVLRGMDGQTAVVDWQGHQLLCKTPLQGLQDGNPVTVSLRPERISVHSVAPAGNDGVPVKVVSSVFKGSRRLLHLAATSAKISAYVESGDMAQPGDTVWITWPPAAPSLIVN